MADTTISLDIRNSVSTDPGWKPSTGTTGYSYLFSGGNADDPNNPGGFKFGHGTGAKSIDIDLVADPRYRITNIAVTYDKQGGTEPSHDLSIPPGNQSNRKWTINDSDVHAESGYFNVTVAFGNVTGIVCDPRWQND